MKVLITCGPTWVPIDDVRVISNVSSGQMGHLIAQAFRAHKAKVTVIQGPVTDAADLSNIRVIKYNYFDELAKVLKQECGKKYDVIVHAAAVSDYKLKTVVKGKISSANALNLALTPTVKLISLIKQWAPQSFLVGFKLESTVSPKNLRDLTSKLFTDAGCDLVLANQTEPSYRGYILNADFEIMASSTHKADIAKKLVRTLL